MAKPDDDAFLGELDAIFDATASELRGDEPESSTATVDPAAPAPDPAAPAAGTSTETDSGNSAEGEAGTGADAPARQPAPAEAALPGDQPPPAASPAAAPEAGTPPAAAAGAKPFTFKAVGGEHPLPGATELPNGSVVIAPEAVTDFRRFAASATELRQNFVKLQRDSARELKRVQEQRTAKDIQADASIALMAEVFAMDPDQRYEWAMKLDEERPKLEAQIREQQLDAREKEIEARSRGPELSPEERREQFAGLATAELNKSFQTIMSSPDAKLLTQDEAKAIYTRWVKRLDVLARPAEADDPALGIKKGQLVFDDTEVVNDFLFALDMKKRHQAPPAPPAPPIPPVVAGGRLPAASAKPADRPFDREEFLQDLLK
jgi:hypothetical protein